MLGGCLICVACESVPGALKFLWSRACFEDWSQHSRAPPYHLPRPLKLTNTHPRFTPLLATAANPSDPSRIITVSSVASTTVPHTGDSGTIMYAASKAAASHLMRQLSIELAGKHITCNTVSPGFFPSKLANGLIEILGGEEAVGRKQNPRGRLGRPEDIAAVMVWLCGRGGGYVSGVEVEVDGAARWGRKGGNEMKL
jgi:NAD(P)-dependent dehydrogenase (short-subunit alcohol dehydrogenase family)